MSKVTPLTCLPFSPPTLFVRRCLGLHQLPAKFNSPQFFSPLTSGDMSHSLRDLRRSSGSGERNGETKPEWPPW